MSLGMGSPPAPLEKGGARGGIGNKAITYYPFPITYYLLTINY
jgi:hypothetical protein